jgi:hypothetical protein
MLYTNLKYQDQSFWNNEYTLKERKDGKVKQILSRVGTSGRERINGQGE